MMPPISSLIVGLVVFHVILIIGSPLGAKSTFLAKFILGYAYFFSLSTFWFML